MIRQNGLELTLIEKKEHYNNLRISPINVPKARDCKPRIRRYEIDKQKFEYPFSYILSCDYSVKDSMGDSEKHIKVCDLDLFPYTISEWIWASVRDTEWNLLCRLHNDIYVLYEAQCSDMGFTIKDSSTSMRIVAGNTLEYIIHRMSLAQYTLYMKKTIPIPIPRSSLEDSGDEIC